MEINEIPITQLKELPSNTKVHPESQIKMLEKSLRTFGFTNPVLINQDGFIIAGHGRIEAAKRVGIKDVPVIRLNFDFKKSIAYNIADNRLAELSENNLPLLKDVLQELDNGELDLETIGYSEDVLENLMTQFHVDDLEKTIARGEEQQEAAEIAETVKERINEKVNEIAIERPDKLKDAIVVIVPLNKGGEVIVIADPGLKDFIDELKRYSGQRSPLEEILAHTYPMKWKKPKE